MNWYKYDQILPYQLNQLWSDSVSILLNDDNLKPDWVEFPAKYTEFHVKRNKKSLLIVIGESWAYGESFEGVGTGIQRYNFVSQLSSCVGARMALMMNADYYQYAVPGNCNFYMFQELSRILAHVSMMNYQQIYICMQMTEPGREKAIGNKLLGSPLQNFYNNIPPNMSFEKWIQNYDETFFKWLDDIILQFNDKIKIKETILWKNFCSTNTHHRYQSFKIVEQSWIQYSARTMGVELKMPQVYAVGWIAAMQEEYKKNLYFDTKFLTEQLDIIEESNNFLKNNPYHYPHPNSTAHFLWAQYLIKTAEWVNGI